MITKCLLSAAVIMTLAACNSNRKSEKELMTETADSFATAFYNYNYGKALELCDSNSRKAIFFITSNMTEKDAAVIRNASEGPSVKINDAVINENSTGTVTIILENVFQKDSIGRTGHIVEKSSIILPLKKNKGRWEVIFKNRKQV